MTGLLPNLLTDDLSKKSWRILAALLAFSSVGVSWGEVFADDHLIEGGKTLFQQQWTHGPVGNDKQVSPLEERGDGLGPMFNATSCEACHEHGGGAGVQRNVTLLTLDPRSEILSFKKVNKRAARNELIDLYPGLLSADGIVAFDVVVHEESARPFYEMIRESVGRHIRHGAPEQWFDAEKRTTDAIANQPVLAGRVGMIDFYLSQRNSPALFGIGVIDKIQISQLKVIARRQASHTKGRVTGRLGVGKLGWRAQTRTLEDFVRGACANELGLQVANSPQPADVADATYVSRGVDLQESEVKMLVSYVRSLPPPTQDSVMRLPEDAALLHEGRRLFSKIGCAICHVENIDLAKGVYSDFLLHDMGSLLQAPSPAPEGPGLASIPRAVIPTFPDDTDPFGSRNDPFDVPSQPSPSRLSPYSGFSSIARGRFPSVPRPYTLGRPDEPKFPRGYVPDHIIESSELSDVTWDMLQREWRTPPLWGVADSAPYLHDGRAETIDSAIRWHDGEAQDAAAQYRSLTLEERKKVLAFLATLRAPQNARRSDSTPDDSQRESEIGQKIEPDPSSPAPTTSEIPKEMSGAAMTLADAIDVFQQ